VLLSSQLGKTPGTPFAGKDLSWHDSGKVITERR
jgi:hypothetical protein